MNANIVCTCFCQTNIGFKFFVSLGARNNKNYRLDGEIAYPTFGYTVCFITISLRFVEQKAGRILSSAAFFIAQRWDISFRGFGSKKCINVTKFIVTY